MKSNEAAASVEVENLRREFESKQNKVVALDGISLQVRQGEIFGVLGPNGAGGELPFGVLKLFPLLKPFSLLTCLRRFWANRGEFLRTGLPELRFP
jgi:ABC-type microcin C transport system duplicated ATPase subunit YejF